jgi:hypothetical protein
MNGGGQIQRKAMRDMHELATRQNGSSDARPEVGELPSSATLDIPAATGNVRAVDASEREGDSGSGAVAQGNG